MNKKVYMMPESHPVSQEYVGEKTMMAIKASEEFRKSGKTAEIKTFGGSVIIDETYNLTWADFPKLAEFLSKNLGVGSYETKARIIEVVKPDALFLESLKSNSGIFKQLPFVDAGYIVGALGEQRITYSTRKPIYEICKKSEISIIPIDSDELMEEIFRIDKKTHSFQGDKESREYQDIITEFREIVRKRSEFMLNEMKNKIDELGTNKIYVSLVGEEHYDDIIKVSQKDIEILHINKRLEALGTDVRYNENDY